MIPDADGIVSDLVGNSDLETTNDSYDVVSGDWWGG